MTSERFPYSRWIIPHRGLLLWVWLLGLGSVLPSLGQVTTCPTSGAVLYFNGAAYVCSADIAANGIGKESPLQKGRSPDRDNNVWRSANRFISTGNDGVVRAAGNRTNQTIVIEPNYPGREELYVLPKSWIRQPLPSSLPLGTHLIDLRNGTRAELFHNPTWTYERDPSATYARFTTCLFDTPPSPLSRPATMNTICDAENSFTTGAGLSLGSPWYVNKAHMWHNAYLTRGISQTLSAFSIKAGTGDSATMYATHMCMGGISSPSDEGCEPIRIQGGMYWVPLQGTTKVSGTGVTSIPVQCTDNCSYAGDGRYLTITSQASGAPFYIDHALRTSGTWTQSIVSDNSAFPVSSAFGVVTAVSGHTAGSVGTNPQPATMTVGTLTGTFTDRAPVCLAGAYYEVAQVTSVDKPAKSQNITAKVRNPVYPGLEVWQGGMCGKGIVFLHGSDWMTVKNSHRWTVWPVAGSPDTHTLRIFGNAKGGQNGPQTAYFKNDVSFSMRSITRTSNVVTGTTANVNDGPVDTLIKHFGKLATITISDASDPSLNGSISGMSFAPNATNGFQGANQFLWNQEGPDIPTDQTATVTVKGIDNAIVLPTMEVVAADLPDASRVVPLMVEYNNNTITASDTLEEPVYQYFGGGGLTVDWNGGSGPLNMGPTPGIMLNTRGNIGESIGINNRNPDSTYAGLGGAATPETAIHFTGVYGSILSLTKAPLKLGATKGAIISVGCPASGCNAGGNGYNIEYLQGNGHVFLTTWNAKTNSFTLNDAGNQWLYTPALTTTLLPLQFTGAKADPSTLASGMLWNRSDLGRPRWYNTAIHSLAFQDELPLPGTTATIGGSSLTAGACASGTARVSGAAVGTPVAVSASDGSLPNPLIILSAAVTATNTVTVQLCAVASVTPTAKTYKVSVIR